jgi:hypothetical protein
MARLLQEEIEINEKRQEIFAHKNNLLSGKPGIRPGFP